MIDQVPFISLNRLENGFTEEFISGVSQLVKNTQFVGGPIVSELETNLSAYVSTKHAICCANGTDALQIALRATGVEQGDKVIIPDMTFWATFEAVVNVGATPVTVDVNATSLHWDIENFKKAVFEFKPKAAIIVHLYGWLCPDILEIRAFAKLNNVILIEDGAQCFGAKINGESIFSSAQISTTSFYPAKVLGASGDAGAIFCNDDDLNSRCRSLINHGRLDHYSHGLVGWNSRIGTYEALYLNLSLKYFEQRTQSRLKAVEYYQKNLKNVPLKIQKTNENIQENGYCSVGIMEPIEREKAIDMLKKNKIGFGTIYPGPMSLQPGAKKYIGGSIDNGAALLISKSILNLPCFAYITEEELNYVCKKINSFY